MGTVAIHANAMKVDRDHLNGYATMRYTDIYMSGGEKALPWPSAAWAIRPSA